MCTRKGKGRKRWIRQLGDICGACACHAGGFAQAKQVIWWWHCNDEIMTIWKWYEEGAQIEEYLCWWVCWHKVSNSLMIWWWQCDNMTIWRYGDIAMIWVTCAGGFAGAGGICSFDNDIKDDMSYLSWWVCGHKASDIVASSFQHCRRSLRRWEGGRRRNC